ncbi:MAG: hypothetical protein NT127_05045 [Sphingobacteriales bacterium]|nr:hypothetical protein [Sphingobacteriales bacterium]
MKTLKQIIFVFLIGLCVTSAQAQKSKDVKKSLFTEFPGSIEISKNTLKNTLVSKPGQLVSIPFNEKFIFTGKVLSNEMKYTDLQTMVIKSEQFPNTLFQLSKILNKDNSISYVGRIINNESLEVYEIKNYLADNYSLQKIDLDKILQDCSY